MKLLSVPKRLWQYLSPKQLAILEACLIGLVSALAAVLLKQGVGWLGGARIYGTSLLPVWIWLPSVGLISGITAGWLVERVAPETSGSGIPQVKAVLARVPIALNLRVAFVKLIGGFLALGSGLTLGREGPTVQMGASLAAQMSYWFPTSPDHRRQLIAAGAGAGLAAAFHAPIAGVMFVVEELLQDFSGITLGTAIVASFIGATVSQIFEGPGLRLLGGQSLDLIVELSAPHTSFSVPEIPFYVVLGIVAGAIGALFNKGILSSMTLYRRVLRLRLTWSVGLAGLTSGLIVALLPIYFRDNTGLRQMLVTGEAGWQMAALVLGVQFVLTLVAYGSGAPGGLFAPTLTLGAALGYLVGLGADSVLGIHGPSTYALVGMATFFCAVARVPMTSIAIVFEMTRDFNLVLPLMISCIVSYLVAEKIFSGSLYDRLLEWNDIYLEKESSRQAPWAQLNAADVMQRRVETLTSQMSLDEVIQAFSRSHHRGFPVVDDGKLVGIVTQTDLANASNRQLPGTTVLSEFMTPRPMTVIPLDTLSEVLYRLNRYNLSRLPVTEGRKLIGIITRSDIIRAESDKLTGEKAQMGPHSQPSYVVYQTRSPATGQGRLLVPLANPQTAPALLKLAAAIARDRHYELECLQVMLVSRHNSPSETCVRTTKSRRLLREAERIGRDWQVPVHTQVRVAHDVAQAIMETINDRHIDLILMGWKGNTSTPGRIFGDSVDTVIRQASCDVVLVKWGIGDRGSGIGDRGLGIFLPQSPVPNPQSPFPTLNRWLIPVAGGPNSQKAVQLLPALVSISDRPEIRLCQVCPPSNHNPDTAALDKASKFLDRRLGVPVISTLMCANSVADALIDLAQKDQCDAIVLGASREGLLQQAIKGNIPEAIARGCNCTVMLVRSAIS